MMKRRGILLVALLLATAPLPDKKFWLDESTYILNKPVLCVTDTLVDSIVADDMVVSYGPALCHDPGTN